MNESAAIQLELFAVGGKITIFGRHDNRGEFVLETVNVDPGQDIHDAVLRHYRLMGDFQFYEPISSCSGALELLYTFDEVRGEAEIIFKSLPLLGLKKLNGMGDAETEGRAGRAIVTMFGCCRDTDEIVSSVYSLMSGISGSRFHAIQAHEIAMREREGRDYVPIGLARGATFNFLSTRHTLFAHVRRRRLLAVDAQ